MNFKDIYSEIIQNKQNHDNGYYNCIPFIGLNRLEKYLPGIEQGTYYLITASTGGAIWTGGGRRSFSPFRSSPSPKGQTRPHGSACAQIPLHRVKALPSCACRL